MIPSILDDALDFNIDRVSLLFRREFCKVLREYAMTQEYWQIMLTLWTTKQTEIIALTLKDKSTISRIL